MMMKLTMMRKEEKMKKCISYRARLILLIVIILIMCTFLVGTEAAFALAPEDFEVSELPFYIYVEKGSLTMTVFGKDLYGKYTVPLKTFPTAIGRSNRMTPTGVFKKGSVEEWHNWGKKSYSPYTSVYSPGLYIHGPLYSGTAFHMVIKNSVSQIGTSASSGCLRTTAEAAYFVYAFCPEGTSIHIVEGAPLGFSAESANVDAQMENPDGMTFAEFFPDVIRLTSERLSHEVWMPFLKDNVPKMVEAFSNDLEEDSIQDVNEIYAYPVQMTILVNGKTLELNTYEIDGFNYLKLRDIFSLLNNGGKPFSVKEDEAKNRILVVSGEPYKSIGGELENSDLSIMRAVPGDVLVYLDGYKIDLEIYRMMGNNYFKLRDLADTLGFEADWDSEKEIVVITTTDIKPDMNIVLDLNIDPNIDTITDTKTDTKTDRIG